MGKKPTKKQMVRAITRLASLNDQMIAAYHNDRDKFRADTMESIYKQSEEIAMAICNEFPAHWMNPTKDENNHTQEK